jgi:outer membrane protein assembly factor BamB
MSHMRTPTLLLILALWGPLSRAENWPQFRGPTGQGISTETNLATEWNSRNVAWATPIPGEGWSSPIVWDNRIFLTAAHQRGTLCHVLCLDSDTGKILWDKQVLEQTPGRKETRNSYATPTPVTDGQHVYAFFGGGGAACLDFAGNVVWTNTDDAFYSQHGLGSSPILYKDLLFMPWDHSIKEGPEKRIGWQIPWDKSYVLALDKNTGKQRFKAMRGMSRISHMTPNVVDVDGKPQLVSAGGDVIEGFDPDTGKLLWFVNTYGEGVTPSPVFGNGLVFNSSGFPTPFGGKTVKAAIRAFKLGGDDKGGDLTKSNLVWEQTQGVPMLPSLLFADSLLYSITESGQFQCLDPADGKVIYKQKLPGQYSASPLFADGHIYVLSDTGTTTVLQPGRAFKQLATSDLGERTQASMAASNGSLFIRTEKNLWCIKKSG